MSNPNSTVDPHTPTHIYTPTAKTSISPFASQHEILAVLARTLPTTVAYPYLRYLEIGVRDGCTLWVVCEAGMGHISHLTLCDTWGTRHGGTGRGSHAHVQQLLRAIGYRGPVEYLDGKSQTVIPTTLAGREFDLIHIDGDHDEEPAYQDLQNCFPLLRPGGAMVVHDTRWPSVERALTRFRSTSHGWPWEATYHSGGKGTAVFWRVNE